MVKKRRSAPADIIAAPKKGPAFAFVLDELDALDPYTKPMFGCTAVYVGDRIVLILRERPGNPEDNGVWLATERPHHESLRAELPSMRSIGVLAGGGVTGWQMLPADGEDFEDEVLRACALVRSGDPRIGKVPKRKAPSGKKTPRRKTRQ
jgi:hypothetical protein